MVFCTVRKMKFIIIRYIKRIQAKGKNKAIGNMYRNSDIAHMPLQRVEAVNPQIFRIGDIVEAQVSFIVVPLKDNKHKMIVVLRSIALLDPYFTQVRTITIISLY